MKTDFIKEKITLYRTLIPIFWTSAFILGGGLYSLIDKLLNLFDTVAFSVGAFFEMLLLFISIILIFRCKRSIKELMEV